MAVTLGASGGDRETLLGQCSVTKPSPCPVQQVENVCLP